VEHKGIKNNMRNTMTITLIIGIVCFIAAFFVYLRTGTGSRSDDVRQFVQNYGALILGAVIALVVTLLAKSFEISRYYIYAILIFCAFCAMNFIQYENIISVSFFSLGVVILVAGIVLLSLFLKKYPRLDKENEQ
jgi:NhaP-type Na+/H+ or K+/H+ antiporter